MVKFDPIIQVNEDGLNIPEVRIWSLEKYTLVGSYCDIFTSGMKYKWDQLVYIDLFAGAGYAKIKENKKVYLNSALIAMSIPTPFTKYILCEQDPGRFAALEGRVKRDFSHLNVQLILGDSNENIDKVKAAIPKYRKGNTLLPFSFVDPFSLNLNFSTIEYLADGLMDFLILQALHMDANRNLDRYIQANNNRIADYLGNEDWREIFASGNLNGQKFIQFLANQYQQNMINLGYEKSFNMHQIRSNDKNLPLYYLAFYSKSPHGVKFFKEVQKRVKPQLSLNL